MRTRIVFAFAFLSILSLGCSDSPQTEVANSNPAGQTGQPPGFTAVRPNKTYSDPRESVNDFLVAVTTGDDATATALLTTKAQQEAWSNGLAISSDGFPNATFDVTAVEQVTETEAHVETVWKDGSQNNYPCVWMLRKEPHGWCIFAMATKFLEDANPIVLPFEDQKEMARLQQNANRLMQEHYQQQMAASPQQQASQIGTATNGQQQQQQIQQASRNVNVR